MAMVAGDLGDAIKTELDTALGSAASSALDADRQAVADAIATAVVNYLSANCDVRITTSDGALQREPVGLLDCSAPSSDKVLSGALE